MLHHNDLPNSPCSTCSIDHTLRWSPKPPCGIFHAVCSFTCHHCLILSRLPVFCKCADLPCFLIRSFVPADMFRTCPYIASSGMSCSSNLRCGQSNCCHLWLGHSLLSRHVGRFKSCGCNEVLAISSFGLLILVNKQSNARNDTKEDFRSWPVPRVRIAVKLPKVHPRGGG